MFANDGRDGSESSGLYVSMNGTHSDLSVVMVVTLLGKSVFRVMFFARVISFRL